MPFIEVRPREHARVRVKGGAYRKLYISDELDRLYGEYLFWLCDASVDMQFADYTAYVFVNLGADAHKRTDSECTAQARSDLDAAQVRRARDLRDEQGRLLQISRTHNFRHTRATGLINAGVPLPVVQRYFGHLSPTMTMRYVQISDQTQRREFLRYKKLAADGRELELDPTDLYQLLELDKRADRILPNGWCLLPSRQACERGNACLTCDKFATDRSYLPEHEQQRDLLAQLIDNRKQAFEARTGREMPEENI